MIIAKVELKQNGQRDPKNVRTHVGAGFENYRLELLEECCHQALVVVHTYLSYQLKVTVASKKKNQVTDSWNQATIGHETGDIGLHVYIFSLAFVRTRTALAAAWHRNRLRDRRFEFESRQGVIFFRENMSMLL
jgi:hypothetical protein